MKKACLLLKKNQFKIFVCSDDADGDDDDDD